MATIKELALLLLFLLFLLILLILSMCCILKILKITLQCFTGCLQCFTDSDPAKILSGLQRDIEENRQQCDELNRENANPTLLMLPLPQRENSILSVSINATDQVDSNTKTKEEDPPPPYEEPPSYETCANA